MRLLRESVLATYNWKTIFCGHVRNFLRPSDNDTILVYSYIIRALECAWFMYSVALDRVLSALLIGVRLINYRVRIVILNDIYVTCFAYSSSLIISAI